jgi:hypothetical protein
MGSIDSPHEDAFIEFANSNNIKLEVYLGQEVIKVINEDGQILS